MRERGLLARVDFLVGYNRARYKTETQDANGGSQQVSVGNPGFNLSQTIVLTSLDNGLDGVTPSNGNLRYGTFNNEVVRYAWNQGNAWTMRDQERVELTARKLLFQDNWYRLEDHVLARYSEVYNKISAEHPPT